MKRNLNK